MPSLHRLHLTHPAPHALAVWEWGAPSKPVVLCVHGLTRNGRDFEALAEDLSRDFRVLAPDMPGRGESGTLPPEHYSNGVYAQDILLMLEALHVGAVHWVGTSMGGILGMMVAAGKPELVKSLVLNDVGSFIPKAALERIKAYAGTPPDFATRGEAEAALRARCAPYGIPSEEWWQHLFAHSIREKAGGFTLTYDPAIVAGLIGAEVADMDLGPLWKLVTCPTLVLRGAQSDLLLESTARDMQASRAGVRYLEVPGAGHAPGLMTAQEIATVRQFIERCA